MRLSLHDPPANALWPELLPHAATLRKLGHINSEIEELLCLSSGLVYQWMGPTPRELGGKPEWPPGLHDRARYLKECGYSITEISEDMKVPRTTVWQWVKGMPCDN
jgi:hypothetical protein